MDKNVSDGLPLPQRYGAILTIVLGIAMAVLDGAIANVALPTIAHATFKRIPGLFNLDSQCLPNSLSLSPPLLPLSFPRRYGRLRRIYKIGLVLFNPSPHGLRALQKPRMLTLARVAQAARRRGADEREHRADSPELSTSAFLGAGWGSTLSWVAVSSAAGADHRRRDSLNALHGNGCF
jgi:DHA2 family multidrug resistance protein-like MFS transporter